MKFEMEVTMPKHIAEQIGNGIASRFRDLLRLRGAEDIECIMDDMYAAVDAYVNSIYGPEMDWSLDSETVKELAQLLSQGRIFETVNKFQIATNIEYNEAFRFINCFGSGKAAAANLIALLGM